MARKPTSRRTVNRILAQRDRLMADVELLRARNGASKFAENAQQLLTRWWSTANWNARAELLKTADWLVRLEARRETNCRLPD